MTGGGDSTLKIWDCETGRELVNIGTKTSVRSVCFSYSGRLILYTTDQAMRMLPEVHIIDINSGEHLKGQGSVLSIQELGMQKPTSTLWGPLDESIIVGHESGQISKWEPRMPKNKIQEIQAHKSLINDMQYNNNQSMFITASKDHTAKV